MTPLPNEPTRTEGCRAAGPTLRGALLWAVVGAALFFGVGAALPIWPSFESRADPGVQAWRTLRKRMDTQAVLPSRLSPTDRLCIMTAVGLIGCGAATGLVGYLARLQLRRKGGAA